MGAEHRKVGEWLEENIDELNRVYGDNRSPVVLILSYALLSVAGSATEEFQTIINEKGDPKMKYEAGSVAEQMVEEGVKRVRKAERLRKPMVGEAAAHGRTFLTQSISSHPRSRECQWRREPAYESTSPIPSFSPYPLSRDKAAAFAPLE